MYCQYILYMFGKKIEQVEQVIAYSTMRELKTTAYSKKVTEQVEQAKLQKNGEKNNEDGSKQISRNY